MKNKSKASALIGSLLLGGLSFFSGCGESAPNDEGNPFPTVTINSLEIENSGSKVIFHITPHVYTSKESNITIDTFFYTKYWNADTADVKTPLDLPCNNGVVPCDAVDAVVCTRTEIGSDYSDYSCDLQSKGKTYPQNKRDFRAGTEAYDDLLDPIDSLVSIGVGAPYVWADGTESVVYNRDENKAMMFNVTNGSQGL